MKTDIISTLCCDDKSYHDMLICISNVIEKIIVNEVLNFEYCKIIIIESTGISITFDLVVFVTSLMVMYPHLIFFGLLHMINNKSDTLITYYVLLTSLKQRGLSSKNVIGFGKDIVAVMFVSRNKIAIIFLK